MEEIMQSNAFFMLPITVAYGTICVSWFLLDRRGFSWQVDVIRKPDKPWLEFVLAIVSVIAVLGVGQLYSHGYLVPTSDRPTLAGLSWMLNNVLIFSPIWLSVVLRKQSLSTVFISKHQLLRKLIFGLAASLLGILVFVLLRQESNRLPEIFRQATTFKSLSNFPAVFFENVALAFLFVRLKWAVGTKWAIVIPSLLFALAHVPGSIAEGDPWGHILAFSLLTSGLTLFILYTAYRSRDIIWLGLVHYLMDIAIKAF